MVELLSLYGLVRASYDTSNKGLLSTFVDSDILIQIHFIYLFVSWPSH